MLLFFSYFSFEYYKLCNDFHKIFLVSRYFIATWALHSHSRPSFIKRKTKAAGEGGDYNDNDDDDDDNRPNV
jgi:hypothetical protein